MQVELINKELTQLLISSYEPFAHRFVFPNGEVLTVEASDVARVYIFVSSGDPITVQNGNAFCMIYILHSLGTLLVPVNSWKITLNYAKYLNEDLSKLGSLNWGQDVVDTLLKGLDTFQTKSSYPSGDFNFLVVSSRVISLKLSWCLW
ncbi:hypothetical protein LINPERPRIM_LOCUS40991 [Linum perenne]